ncbi:MAG: hypothetical protein R3B90_04705 [Planctomycetaceae bacterium]
MDLIPPPLLVRCRLPIPRIDTLPHASGELLRLPERCRIALPSALGKPCDWADLRGAWNPKGLGFRLTVTGRKLPTMSRPDAPTQADSLQLWIDTRETQNVHRATRYCHHLCILPTGGGDAGQDAIVIGQPVARARDDAKQHDSDEYLCRSRLLKTGYELDVWLPAATLTGYDPAQQPRLGFCASINDAEHGRRTLGVGPELPSTPTLLWHSLVLTDG